MVNSVQSLNNINTQRLAFGSEAGYAKTNAYPNDSYEKKSNTGKVALGLALLAAFVFRKDVSKFIKAHKGNSVVDFVRKNILFPAKKYIINPLKSITVKPLKNIMKENPEGVLAKSTNWTKTNYNGLVDRFKV